MSLPPGVTDNDLAIPAGVSPSPVPTTSPGATGTGDTNGTPAETVSTTLTITAKGRVAQLQDLQTYVTGIGPGTSLSSKVQVALNREQAGGLNGTCHALTSIINEATAQTGKHLTSSQATTAITAAERIQLGVGC